MTDIKDNSKSEDNFRKPLLWLVAISTACIVVSMLLQYKNQDEVRELHKTMQEQSKTLETIQHSLETVNSSIQQIKKDTLLVKEVDD